MRGILLLIIVLGAGWLAYSLFTGRFERREEAPAQRWPAISYSPQLEPFIGEVTAELGATEREFSSRLRELSALQGELRTQTAEARESDREILQRSQSLAAALKAALAERIENEQILARRLANPSQNLQRNVDEQAQETFVLSLKNRWAERAKIWRAKLDGLLASLRAAEQAPEQ